MNETNTSAEFVGSIHYFVFGYVPSSVLLIISNDRKMGCLSVGSQGGVSAPDQVFSSVESLFVAAIKRNACIMMGNILVDKGLL